MKMIITNTLFFLCVFSFFSLNAQKPPAKFGKVDTKLLTTEKCPVDENAHAYYVFDFSKVEVELITESDNRNERSYSFRLIYKNHCRIKIVDNQGLDWANISIPVYKNEKILTLKAASYNIENGKVVKTNFNKSNLIKEETTPQYETCKFAILGVKAGSVIEVYYTMESRRFRYLRKWFFQKSIPVLQNEYYAIIPEFIHYNALKNGEFISRDELTKKLATGNYGKVSTAPKVEYEEVTSYEKNIYSYRANYVKAFPDLPYLETPESYMTSVQLELGYVIQQGIANTNYAVSWFQITDDLMHNIHFGQEFRKTSHLSDWVSYLKAKGQTGVELMNSAHHLVSKKILWNRNYTKYTETNIVKPTKIGNGNCSDINLNLLLLLRELGFEAYPVILSSRNNGFVNSLIPTSVNFNYVIVLVKYEGKNYLLDATESYSGVNLLPTRCLNGYGLIVDDKLKEWVPLENVASWINSSSYSINLSDNLDVSGKAKHLLSDYASFYYQKKYKGFNSVDEFADYLEEEFDGFHISSLSVGGDYENSKKMELSYDYTKDNVVGASDSIIYFSPVLFPDFNNNPFVQDNREYPVEYNYPIRSTNSYEITIPDNYNISEIPSKAIIVSKDKGMRYTYNISPVGNKIILTTILNIRKSRYPAESYNSIKEFYDKVVSKQKQMVVLKKQP